MNRLVYYTLGIVTVAVVLGIGSAAVYLHMNRPGMVHGNPFKRLGLLEIVSIKSGDTIEVMSLANEKITIHLDSIVLPSEDYWRRSTKQLVFELESGKHVQVLKTGELADGTIYGFDWVDGVDVCKELLLQGLARHERSRSDDDELIAAEFSAQFDSRGLWTLPGF